MENTEATFLCVAQERGMVERCLSSWKCTVIGAAPLWLLPDITIHSWHLVTSLWIREWYQLSIHHFFISVPQHSNCNSLLLGLVRPSYTSGEIFVSFSAPNTSQLYLGFLRDKQMEPIISRPALITQLVEPRFSLWNINKGSKKSLTQSLLA